MENTNLAQWVIDNRYAKSEKEKVSDVEMYHNILEHTAQLQADKEEMVRMLERCENRILPTENHSSLLRDLNELIQKMKE